MTTDLTPAATRATTFPEDVSREAASSEDTARRVLAALLRSGARARRVAAQTGTCIVVFRDGEVVIEPVAPSDVEETVER